MSVFEKENKSVQFLGSFVVNCSIKRSAEDTDKEFILTTWPMPELRVSTRVALATT
jgi:hypothetical protein